MPEKIARFVMRFRFAFALSMVLFTLFLLYQLKDLNIVHDIKGSLPKNHPYVLLDEKVYKIFGGGNLVAIGVVVNKGDIFNKETIAKVYRITQEVKTLRAVVPYRVSSITSKRYSRVWITTDDLFGGPMINSLNLLRDSEMAMENPEHMKIYKEGILHDQMIYGSIVSKDMKGTVILADFEWLKDYRYIFESIKKIAAEERDGNTEIYFGGRPITLGYIQEYMGKIWSLFGFAIAIMCLLLFLAFRKIRGMLLPLLAGIMSVIWGLGIMQLTHTRLDLMSVTVPFLILAVTVSHSVQVVKRFNEEFAASQDKIDANEKAISTLLVPAFTSILADNIGFIGLYFLPFDMMKSIVIVGRVGVASIIFTCTFFIPVMNSFLPPPKRTNPNKKDNLGILDKILVWIAHITSGKGKWVVLPTGIILCIIFFWGYKMMQLGDTEPGASEFWADSPCNRDLKVLNEKFTGVNPYYIYVEGKKPVALWEPDLMEDIDNLQRHLEARPDVLATFSYVNKVKRLNRAWHIGEKDYSLLPQTRNEGCFFVETIVTQGEPEDSRGFLELNMREANIQVFMTDHKTETILSVIEDTKNFLKKNKKSGADFHVAAGVIGLYASIIDVIGESHYLSLIIVGVALFLVCWIFFQSLYASVIICIPLAVGTLVVYGLMGFYNIGLFLPTMPVGAIGMGVGIDYAIYILHRMIKEFKGGENLSDCFQKTLKTSGKAVVFTAASLFFGVLVLLLSELRFQAVMGGLLAAVFFVNLVSTLFILPTLVAILKPKFVFREREVMS